MNNPELRAGFYNWKATLQEVDQVDVLPDPRFTLGYYIRSVETRTGPQRASIGLSQTFPWLGKLSLKGDAASRRAEEKRARFEALRLKLFNDVKNAYYEYAYLGKAIETTREQIALLEFLEKIASARYTAGLASNADVVRTQVELGRLEDRLRSLEDLRHPLAARLNQTMNRPPEAEIPFPVAIPVMLKCDTDAALHEALESNNPEVMAAERRMEAEQVGVDLARKEFYPDLTVGVRTIVTDEALNEDTPDSGKDPVIASVSLNLPIWIGKREAGVREAEARVRAARREQAGLVNSLSTDLEFALYEYHEAERRIDLYADSLIPKAKQSLNVTLEAYQSGQGTALDLLDVEQTLIEFRLSYYRALADQAQRLAQMEMLIGRAIPCEVHGAVEPEGLLDKSYDTEDR
jgi:outer membrane protein TolC